MAKNPKLTLKDLTQRPITPFIKKMIGNVYGRLTVVSYAGVKQTEKSTSYYINCKCVCGKDVLAGMSHVKSGRLSSCGCYKIDHPSRFKHGYAPLRGKREKIYHAWKSMHARCSERLKEHDKTRKYGEKGIKVCEGWSGKDGFVNFKDAMNPPTDKSVDRIDNDLNYSCGKCEECIREGWNFNCRWGNDEVQSNNRGAFNKHVVIDGQMFTFAQAEIKLGYTRGTISGRVRSGWNLEDAVKPITIGNGAKAVEKLDLNGIMISEYPSVTDAANKHNVVSSNITQAISGAIKTCRGFKWRFKIAEN